MLTSARPRMQHAPAGLILPQFISWRLVPDAKGNLDKQPCNEHGTCTDAHNRSIWRPFDAIARLPFGVGFVLTREARVVCIDIDHALGSDGQWKPIVHEVLARFPEAYVEISQSGSGLHVMFLADVPEGHRCKSRCGQLELYSMGRFIALTGTGARGRVDVDYTQGMPAFIATYGLEPEPLPELPADGRSPLWSGPEDDDELIELMLRQVVHTAKGMFEGQASVAEVWRMDAAALTRSWPAEGRADGLTWDQSSVDMSMISHLSYFTGRDVERMERLLRRWPGFREWKFGRARGYYMRRTLIRGLGNKSVLGEKRAALLGQPIATDGAPGAVTGEFFAHMPSGKFFHIGSGKFWPQVSVDAALPSVPDGADQFSGQPKFMKPSKWLMKNKPVHDISWWPGMPLVVVGHRFLGAEIRPAPGVNMLNTYIPPAPPSGDPSQAGPWINHVRMLYPEDYGTIIQWMAFVAQNPAVKVNWAVVIGGAMRIGKDTMFKPLELAVGSNNYKSVSPEYIMTQPYDDYLQCRVLVINEAKDLGGENRFNFYEKTKPIIAAPPEVRTINPKQHEQFTIPNLNATVIMTNYLTGGLYLPHDDGRHAVFWSTMTRPQIPDAYFQQFYAWANASGFRDAAAYLMTVDTSGFDPKGMPPRNKAFHEMVEGSRPDEQNDLIDVIATFNGNPFTIKELSMAALVSGHEEVANWLKGKHRRRISLLLSELGCDKYENKNERRGRWLINGKQEYKYRLA